MTRCHDDGDHPRHLASTTKNSLQAVPWVGTGPSTIDLSSYIEDSRPKPPPTCCAPRARTSQAPTCPPKLTRCVVLPPTPRIQNASTTGVATATVGSTPGWEPPGVAISKLRQGSYYPDWLLDHRTRAESALTSVVATCYLKDVATRRVEDLIATCAISRMSKSTASRWRRDLWGGWWNSSAPETLG